MNSLSWQLWMKRNWLMKLKTTCRNARCARKRLRISRAGWNHWVRGQNFPSRPWQEAKPAARFRLGWVSFAGGAALAGLLLFFYFIGMNARTPDLAMVQDQDNLFEDENFMQEISDIVDSPFPEDIYDITGDAADSEDDFLQFVVPDPQEELQS
jgi:hypothetical protein